MRVFRTTNELMLSTHVPSKVTKLTKLFTFILVSYVLLNKHTNLTLIRFLVRVNTHEEEEYAV